MTDSPRKIGGRGERLSADKARIAGGGFRGLILAGLRHYRGLNLLVVAGVAVSVAVLAGALLVGASVRASLRELALARLGRTELVVSSTTFFREALGDDLQRGGVVAAPILAMQGTVTHERSRRTAARIDVFGIDDRFLAFHGHQAGAPRAREAWISQALATELGAHAGDGIVLRLAKPSDIPLSTLQGRREDVSERVLLTLSRVADRQALGEFSLRPAQGPALSVFVPLSRLQLDLGIKGRTNALLVRQSSGDTDRARATETVKGLVRQAATLEDLGLTVRSNAANTMTILESRSGLITRAVSEAAAEAASATGQQTIAALTYLANSIRARGREIPYSLISAVDLDAYERLGSRTPPTAPTIAAAQPRPALPHPPIRLNTWAAEDLGVTSGDRVDVEYYLWSDERGLETGSAPFTFVGVVPMTGAGGDATLTPEYPGITDAGDVTSWDPPFPVDMQRVRKKDEEYWDAWRTAPKAFIPLEVGQQLWQSPFGNLSSLRTTTTSSWPPIASLDLFRSGITVTNAQAEALAAADGTTDFGEYFVYFSFFIVVAGLLLAGLFFALIVEQRARELGLLLAVGFSGRNVRRLLLGEALVLAAAGSAIGIAGAIGYAALIMYGLRTWWVGAVGTTALELHVDLPMLAAGAAGALVAALVALAVSFRRVGRRSARSLLTSGLQDAAAVPAASPTFDDNDPVVRPLTWSRFSRAIPWTAALLSLFLIALATTGGLNQVAAFFLAGALAMIAGCAAFASWLKRPAPHSQPYVTLPRFGAAYARWRPTRSVLSTVLIAFACFVIVAVGAFRRDVSDVPTTRESGTGGFSLIAESVAPLLHNPNSESGRTELGLAGFAEMDGVQAARFRVRPGDEASCLTLYQPRNPRIIAPEQSFVADKRFTFASSLAETDEERANPWLLLEKQFSDGAVPAIADQTSLTYVFHLAVGDDFVFTPEGSSPIVLRIVGALADSVLQSEMIVGERHFVRLFPRHEGYRMWLLETPESQAVPVITLLEDRLSDFGVDVIDARVRLASYHQVENTYLSTFQALGALGLLLGTLGLAAVLSRNVLERRRELGLLGAVGFTRADIRTIVTTESLLLVVTGVVIGAASALLAVAPAITARAEAVPLGSLAGLIVVVIATGLLASVAAVRVATSLRVIEALKSE